MEAVLGFIDLPGYIKRHYNPKGKNKWRTTFPHQLCDKLLPDFSFSKLKKFMDIDFDTYYGEFRALVESECHPGISYDNLELDLDLNMMNKVARLRSIKMLMIKKDI